jgi:hypothetical protein
MHADSPEYSRLQGMLMHAHAYIHSTRNTQSPIYHCLFGMSTSNKRFDCRPLHHHSHFMGGLVQKQQQFCLHTVQVFSFLFCKPTFQLLAITHLDYNMYPNRNSSGGTRRGASGFQPTFVNSGGLLHRTGSSRQIAAPSARSNSTRTAQPTNADGRTTVVRPGQPHYFDTRSDFETGRLINTLCRCRDPNSHGNAWTVALPGHYDRSGREIPYQQLLNRILDHYGTATVSNKQQTAA